MSRQTQIADLLRQASHAPTLSEQVELVRQAELLKNEALEERTASWSAEDAVINDTLVPGRVHELHTASTDWLLDVETGFDPREANNKMVAEASLWFGRVNDDVKSYADEYQEQARNLARRLAGQFGEGADVAERAFVDEANRLRTQAVKAGLVTEANYDCTPEEQDESFAMGAPIHSNGDGVQMHSSLEEDPTSPRERMMVRQASFVDDLYESLSMQHTANEVAGAQPDALSTGLPAGATDSNRGPVMQELAVPNPSQDVVPVNDPGLSNKQPFPVSGNRKESNMHVTCPNCHGQGKVAVHVEAASGLPQIDQIVDPHDNPAQTPYPGEVAFPWTLNPAAQVQQHVQEGEAQIAERNQRSPLASGAAASRHTAGGRDNSGWVGDMGAKGVDYPGYQVGQFPQGQAGGYVDPVYGQGGDQAPGPQKPYGNEECQDYTNNPGMNWQPGQPTQADQAWRSVTNVPGGGSQQAGPGGSVQASWKTAVDEDPNLRAALEYVEAARRRVGR
jgi:hypothetical protein